MELAFSEMPLALFTTLASVGAGAFIAWAVALFTAKLDEAQLKKLDTLNVVSLAFVIVGFVAAFFHLTNVMNAVNVFGGLGASPLSNEVAVGCVFTVVALVFVILAAAGKLNAGAREGFAAVVAVLAVVFAVFMGVAYMMPTIPSWDTPAAPVQMLGFALAGGAALEALLVALAGAKADDLASFKTAGLVLSVLGVVLGAGGLLMQMGAVSGLENAVYAGADLVAAAMPFIVAAVAALVAACVCTVLALRGTAPVALGVAAAVLAVAGVLCARLVFYALQLSVGLCLM